MLRLDGTAVPLFWPGGESAGQGVFRNTGTTFPNTYELFFLRYNGGKWLIFPGSAIGGSLGIRAQVGGGEGHVEQTLSPLLMRAAVDPLGNPWQITPADVSQANIDLTLMDFQALYGKDGLALAMERYGSPNVAPPAPPATPPPASGEIEALRAKVDKLTKDLVVALEVRDTIRIRAMETLAKLPPAGGGAPARIGREFCKWVLEQ